jgi:AAA15 family ATPase/GTPase
MVRLASILLRIANTPGGVVLIDEIDSGLHHSVLRDVWKVIGSAAETFDTQIFATTHSYECIREAHEAFKESDNYIFRLHRLDRVRGKVESVTYDEEALTAAIKAEFEVR